jgi:arsenate reductase
MKEASDRRLRVLFVCTGNSARSQMAEAILRARAGDHFEPFSAGVDPRGINPLTVQVLQEARISTDGLRSKSVNEMLDRSFDYVITVCDRARESCPVFPGSHESFHWGLDDPAEATGTEAERLAVFRRVMAEIVTRIDAFVAAVRHAEASAAGSQSSAAGS